MPQPIDPQTEMGRATAVERIQQIADRASLAAQSRSTVIAAGQQRDMETQVQQSAFKSDEVERELRRRNPFVGRRKKRDGEGRGDGDERCRHFYNAAEKDVLADDPQDHHLDVEI